MNFIFCPDLSIPIWASGSFIICGYITIASLIGLILKSCYDCISGRFIIIGITYSSVIFTDILAAIIQYDFVNASGQTMWCIIIPVCILIIFSSVNITIGCCTRQRFDIIIATQVCVLYHTYTSSVSATVSLNIRINIYRARFNLDFNCIIYSVYGILI